MNRTDEVMLSCVRGDDFLLDVDLQDADGVALDLTACTAAMQVRVAYDDTSARMTATVSWRDQSAGQFRVLIPRNQTAVSPGRYVYDLQVSTVDYVTTVARGAFLVEPEVTR